MGERALEGTGWSGRQYGVLAVLAGGPPAAQHLVGAAIGVDRTTTVALVTALERRGLVVRTRDPGDRRAYLVALTSEGDAARERAEHVLRACKEEFLAPLAAEERDVLRTVLGRLVGTSPHDPGGAGGAAPVHDG